MPVDASVSGVLSLRSQSPERANMPVQRDSKTGVVLQEEFAMTDAELVERLERLGRDNRRLKAVALAALILPIALLLVGAAQSVHTVKANKFVLLDSQGRTRAVLQVGPVPADGASLTFADAAGRKRVALVGGTGLVGNAYAYLELGEDAATEQPVLTSAGGHGGVTLSDGGLVMRAGSSGSVLLQGPGPNGPALEMTDPEGYTLDLGRTQTLVPANGETRQTSAASIVMFGNDKKRHVIWEAPR